MPFEMTKDELRESFDKRLFAVRKKVKIEIERGIRKERLNTRQLQIKEAILIYSIVRTFCKKIDMYAPRFNILMVITLLGKARWRDIENFCYYVTPNKSVDMFDDLINEGYIVKEKLGVANIFMPTAKAKTLMDNFTKFYNTYYNKAYDEFKERKNGGRTDVIRT